MNSYSSDEESVHIERPNPMDDYSSDEEDENDNLGTDDDDDDNDDNESQRMSYNTPNSSFHQTNDASEEDSEDDCDEDSRDASMETATPGKLTYYSEEDDSEDDEDGDDSIASPFPPSSGKVLRQQTTHDDSDSSGEEDVYSHLETQGLQSSVPSGKVLRLESSGIDEDERNTDPSLESPNKSADAAGHRSEAVSVLEKAIPSATSTPPPSQEETPDNNFSSDDDDALLVSHKSKRKKKTKGKKKISKTLDSKASKDDTVAAAVVVDDNHSDSDGAVVVVAEEVPKKKRKKPGPKPKKKPSKGHKKKGSSKSKQKNKKRKRGVGPGSDSDESSCYALDTASVPVEKMEAAEQARDILVHSVQRVPFEVSDAHIVRNFGRLKIEEGVKALESLYSTPNILHPVGFSCDRFEFSPIHGRMIKLRCDILDGSKVKGSVTPIQSDKEPILKEEDVSIRVGQPGTTEGSVRDAPIDGPIFRIMWGPGIDESEDTQTFPFDLYSSSAPLGGEVDAVAVPVDRDTITIAPEEGMRVKVRFDNDMWYAGHVRNVSPRKVSSTTNNDSGANSKKKNKKKKQKDSFDIQITYDDGGKEDAVFPDPDVILLPPGAEETADGCLLDVKELKGKSVTTITGRSALYAWGKVLIHFGLIDEIIFEKSIVAITAARVEGIAEAKDKMNLIKQQRQLARARHIQRQKEKSKGDKATSNSPLVVRVKGGETIGDLPEAMVSTDDEGNLSDNGETGGEREDATEEELELREKAKQVLELYEKRLAESRTVAIELADARIKAISPFLCNPFFESEYSSTQQKTWLTTVVRKEKSKMGSTGNRRKVVTATDLLEKSASLFNSDIEHLLEGLPGSEFCQNYVFHEMRGSGAVGVNQSWMHEATVRQEREQVKRSKRNKENEAKASQEREKERKRKAREDEKEVRKKQRMEELDLKKKARAEERLSRLSTQIDERLFKEACFQRDRVVLLASKLFNKEVIRRRKAAEGLAAYTVESEGVVSNNELEEFCTLNELPPHSTELMTGVIRIWDFISSYRSALNAIEKIPSLEDLQNAINALDMNTSHSSRNEAINLLTNIAVALCQPISSGVIKSLSSSLSTSLNETENQKKENDDSNEGEKTVSNNDLDPDNFPVNAFTWKEIARLALLSDALNELGYSKIEQAHLLRGFRSGGHPNSKEAKRLRRGEDNALVLRRQALTEKAAAGSHGRGFKISVETPSTPSVVSTNWVYFLHNIKSLPTNAATGMKNNLRKAMKVLKRASFEIVNGETVGSIISELQRNVSILEEIGTSYTSSTDTLNACKKVRHSALRLLDKVTGEIFSTDVAKAEVNENIDPISIRKQRSTRRVLLSLRKIYRKKVGLLQSLALSDDDYKSANLRKEEYMAAALKLKEDLERKNTIEDDDDDDDDEEDDEVDKGEKEEQNHDQKVRENAAEAEVKQPIGKKTEYDDFCGDDPSAPDFIRRCLAVLRTVCALPAAEEFLYPVDPQANSKYYDAILRPMSLYDAGKALQSAGKRLRKPNDGHLEAEVEVEKEVAQFGRNIRLICQNCTCFSNVGGMIISSAEEMIRVFERLLFDWVLSPFDMLPPLDMLDDEKCVEFHPSDEEELVLLCDGCEGKFNMSRLDPPLLSVPRGDWYCPRCLEGRCWSTLDPRIGRKILKEVRSSEVEHTSKVTGIIKACKFSSQPDITSPKNTFCYTIKYENGTEEIWSLDAVDKALLDMGNLAPKIHCLEATAESPGYGSGVASELIMEAVPVPLNPCVSDAAAQKAVSSISFQESIVAGASLLVNETSEMSSSEWIRLLILLVMKCASSDPLQDAASQLESEAFQKAGALTTKASKIKSIRDMVPQVTDDEDDRSVSTKNTQSNNTMNKETIVSMESSESEIDEKKKTMALVNSRKERQKARDDVMLASCIKSQIKPALASFYEDHVTQVIDNSLASKVKGITLSSCQSSGMVCDFCGLSDSALGSALVRVPNLEEWTDRMHIASKEMNANLIAKFSKDDRLIESNDALMDSENKETIINTEKAKHVTKFVSVQVRIGGKLFSIKEENPHIQDCINDSGMLDFLPRNATGFRHELEARVDSGLPFISGSLSGHECCARAVHKARVEKVIQKKKQEMTRIAHRNSGNWCGRTLSLGCDKVGRTYWKFLSDPESLFVRSCRSDGSKIFKRFSDPETIASVIVFLGNHSVVTDIKDAFPKARKILESGAWKTRLLMREREKKEMEGSEIKANLRFPQVSEGEEFDIYAEGEDILVESICGKLLWNGSIIAVANNSQKRTLGYRIRYTGWSSRFDEWVHPERLLEPSDENLQAQTEMQSALLAQRTSIPGELQTLTAIEFLNAPHRASHVIISNISKLSGTNPGGSSEDKSLALMRTAVLLIEASLPRGSVDASEEGTWKPEIASSWRALVADAQTPAILTGYIILLENVISKDFLRSNAQHLLSCLPRPWKAVNEATISSIALKLFTLDRGIKYDKTNNDEDEDWLNTDND